MSLIFPYINILRPLNLIFAALSVVIAAYLTDSLNQTSIIMNGVMVVVSFAGASNILNDILDINIDKINCPERILPSGKLKIFQALLIMGILFSVGIIASTYLLPIGKNISLFLILPILILYTPIFKKLPL